MRGRPRLADPDERSVVEGGGGLRLASIAALLVVPYQRGE
jgi:hypothetical protein